MFSGTYEDKVLVPAIGFEAVVDVVGGGEIGKDLPPATFVVDDRDYRVLVAAADAFGLIQFGPLGRIEAEQNSDDAIVFATGKCVAFP